MKLVPMVEIKEFFCVLHVILKMCVFVLLQRMNFVLD